MRYIYLGDVGFDVVLEMMVKIEEQEEWLYILEIAIDSYFYHNIIGSKKII